MRMAGHLLPRHSVFCHDVRKPSVDNRPGCIMKILRSASILLLGFFSTISPGHQALAQTPAADNGTWHSDLADMTVSVRGDHFAISDSDTYDEGAYKGDRLYLESDLAYAEVSFFDDPDTPEESIETIYGSLEDAVADQENFNSLDVIAEGVDGDVLWQLVNANYQEGDIWIYLHNTEDVVGNVDMMEVLLAPAQTFDGELETAQSDITIDDNPFLGDVAYDDLQAAVEEGGSPATPDATESGGGGDNPRTDALLPGMNATPEPEETSTPVVEPTATEQPSPSGTTTSDTGLTSDTSWSSPTYGVELTWDDTSWVVDSSGDDAIVVDDGMDTIRLVRADGEYGTIYVDIVDGEGRVPADYVDVWTSDEFASQNLGPDDEILDDRQNDTAGAVLLLTHSRSGDEVIALYEAVDLGDGTVAIVSMFGLPDSFVDDWSSASSSLEVNGAPLLTVFNQRQIERALP